MRNEYGVISFDDLQVVTTHLQAQLLTPNGSSVAVDELLAPLLSTIWELGYETRFSCQGGDAPENSLNSKSENREDFEGYIFFATPEMGRNFLEVVKKNFPAGENTLYSIDGHGIVRFVHESITLFEYSFGIPSLMVVPITPDGC